MHLGAQEGLRHYDSGGVNRSQEGNGQSREGTEGEISKFEIKCFRKLKLGETERDHASDGANARGETKTEAGEAFV